jgi:hypothetical protein
MNEFKKTKNMFGQTGKKVLSISFTKTFSIYVVIAIFFFGLTRYCDPPFDKNRAGYMEQNTDKIKIGMTKQELKALLGKPNDYAPKLRFFYDDEGLEKATSWLYLYPDDHMSHHIEFDASTGRIIKSEKESTGLF